MKYSLSFIFFTLITVYYLSAQPCPTNINFENQADIDNFQGNYPGCTTIEGNVTIGPDIENLNGLNVLISIGGDLWIHHNSGLLNLAGLDNLVSVGRRMVISDNNALVSLEGLNALVNADSGIFILDNASLSSLSGLESFIGPAGSLEIENNDALNDLSSLSGLTSVENNLTILDNDILGNLAGLHNIASCGGDVTVKKNRSLTSLNGLNGLENVSKSLRVTENEYMTSLAGLDQLATIGESLEITDNELLEDISSLVNLDVPMQGNLAVFNNPVLSDCQVQPICEYLSNPEGKVIIHHNGQGCNYVVEIATACGITLSCLPYGDYYFITQEYLDEFPVDFPGCTQLEGNVVITGEDITDLGGLDQVTSIGADLQIWYNSALTSLEQLSNLSNIGSGLVIVENDQLTSLEGVDNIDLDADNSLYIVENDNLYLCDQENVCYFINNFGNMAIFSNNATGCATIPEVAEACGILNVPETAEVSSIDIFPNPASTGTDIQIPVDPASNLTIRLFNMHGQNILSLTKDQADMNGQYYTVKTGFLPAGLYFIEIKTDSARHSGRLIISD